MANISDVFEKIIVDGHEINLQSLVTVNGLWGVGGQKDVEVEYVLKNNTTIPPYLFANLKQLNSVYMPQSVKNIGEYAFTNSGVSYIDSLSYVETIGDYAFSYTYLTYVNGINSNQNISNNAFSYITTLSEESKENILTYHPNSDFGYMTYNSSYSYTYIDPSTNDDGNNSYTYTDPGNNEGGNSYNGNNSYNGGSTIGYDPNAMNYTIGTKYRMPLNYTTRSGERYVHILGDVTFEIVDIDQTVENSDPYKVKFRILGINITNSLPDRVVDHYTEIVNRCFWSQDSCLTADIDMFKTVPGFVEGIDGVDSFLTMKTTDDTYFPELENDFGVTDYAIRKTSNDMSQFIIDEIEI